MSQNKQNTSITIRELYQKEAIPTLQKEFGYTNVNALPKIEKVVVNVGVGKIHKESQAIEAIAKDLAVITGQKPVIVMSKKAIAGFKIRKGAPSGVKVTLRGPRMWDFLDRLILVALPRTRDFQGLENTVVDKNGNANIGIKEHIIFPEIRPEKVFRPFSLQVTVVTTTNTYEVASRLFKIIRFPFKMSK
jgi:large subunit ribosomal protein L5